MFARIAPRTPQQLLEIVFLDGSHKIQTELHTSSQSARFAANLRFQEKSVIQLVSSAVGSRVSDSFTRSCEDKEEQRCHHGGPAEAEAAQMMRLSLALTKTLTPAELSGLLRLCSGSNFASWQTENTETNRSLAEQ